MVQFINIENLKRRLVRQPTIYGGGFPRKYLTIKSHNAKRLRQRSLTGSKYASKGFQISEWFLLFHHTLLKEPLEVDLKLKPFEVELAVFQ